MDEKLYDTKYPDINCKISHIHFKNRVCKLRGATCCCDSIFCYPNIMTEGSTSQYINVVRLRGIGLKFKEH